MKTLKGLTSSVDLEQCDIGWELSGHKGSGGSVSFVVVRGLL